MALTAKIKLLRILSVVQCCIAVWLVVLGIVERVRVRWQQSGLGMPVWFGIWVGITGAFGIFITFKHIQNTSHGPVILQHLAVTLMGFSLTCGVLSALLIFNYSHELSIASHKQLRYYTRRGDENFVLENISLIPDVKYSEEHTLVGFIFGFTVVELIVAMWSAAICRVSDHQKSPTEEERCETPLIVSPSSQGQGGQSVASRFGYTAGNA
ncbi:unnamed protein product [Porites lobata]|uniref:Uncharacterized protein n=1 Tax=Porites lobata TaxID=104759 RepID=A0ABN8Q104_9CNID|nr:unnamed protein product [Porites lobata]